MMKIIFKLKSINKETFSLYKNIFLSYLLKGGSLTLSLLLTPMYMRYFSNQVVLGGWFTALSILNWIMYFDLGIGNGLRNKLAISISKNNLHETKTLISSTYIIMSVVVLCIFVVGMIVLNFLNLNAIFDVPSTLINSNILKISVSILFMGTILSFYFNLSTSIMHTLQKSGITGIFSIATNLIVLLFMLFVKNVDLETRFLYLSITFALAVSLPLIISTVFIFRGRLRGASPKIRYFNYSTAKTMLKLGGLFFWIQISLLVINSTDQILITRLFGSSVVVEYQIYHKIFYLVITLFSLVTNPLWASITKANTEMNYAWIIDTKKKLYVYAILFSIVPIFLVLANQFIFDIWLGSESIPTNFFYSIIFGMYSIVMIWLFSVTAIANGLTLLKVQFLSTTIGMILKIPLTILLSLLIDSWVVIMITNLIIMGFNLAMNFHFIEKHLKTLTKNTILKERYNVQE